MDTCKWNIRSLDWNNTDGIKYSQETIPVLNMTTPLYVGADRRLIVIEAYVTQSMKLRVYLINISTLSKYRKDAHSSIQASRQGHLLTKEQQTNPKMYADCIHWCSLVYLILGTSSYTHPSFLTLDPLAFCFLQSLKTG